MKMPFGRFKGWEVGRVPEQYLRWLWNRIDLFGPLYVEVQHTLVCHVRRRRRELERLNRINAVRALHSKERTR